MITTRRLHRIGACCPISMDPAGCVLVEIGESGGHISGVGLAPIIHGWGLEVVDPH